MANCYIVTYDLNKETKRPPIVDKIREFDGWAKLSESSYAISVDLTAVQVFKKLQPLLDGNDQLYVISIGKPYFGQGLQEVNDWLDQSLP